MEFTDKDENLHIQIGFILTFLYIHIHTLIKNNITITLWLAFCLLSTL